MTDAVDPAAPQDEAAVDRALRTALQHRLDRFSLGRLAVRVCRLDRKDDRTHAFVNALIRFYETHEVPFNAALFAGALASVVREHRFPTATDFYLACESEARLYPLSCVVAGDEVLLGRRSLWTDGLLAHVSVVTLGTVPPRGSSRRSEDVWGEVEEIRVEGGRAVAVTCCGSVVLLDRAEVVRQDEDRVYGLAVALSMSRHQTRGLERGH